MSRSPLISLAMAVLAIAAACAPANTQPAPPTLVPPIETEVAGPTPLPVRTPHPPGELFPYSAQSGDTLASLAAHFRTRVAEIRAANPGLPDEMTTLPVGYPLQIPAYYVPLTGSPFHILPDSEVVYGPSVIGFDLSHELRKRPGFLADLSDYAYKRQRTAWEVVDIIARNYSVNPRVLLALLEYQTGALTSPFPSKGEETYPLGLQDPAYARLFWQLIWAGEHLNDGYYGWRTGELKEFETSDGLVVRPDPWLNAGTVAIQFTFASLYDMAEFEVAVSPGGFQRTYREIWGDPFDLEMDLIPGNLQQPELSLPFLPNRIWDFTAGPHFSWGTSLPLGALDFAPPAEETGCTLSREWIAAPAAGVIARSDEATVILDLDGDGEEGSGWILFFFHVATRDRVESGVRVEPGDLLGHPSCEGGRATGTHFHLARRYNGEWIPAGGDLPFALGGWVASYGESPYQGVLTRGSRTVTASEFSPASSRILYEFP